MHDGERDIVLTEISEREMRKIRGRRISMIFQEPMTSLNPVFTIGDQIMEAIMLHQDVGKRRSAAPRHRHAAEGQDSRTRRAASTPIPTNSPAA